jgi:hypothetical protein
MCEAVIDCDKKVNNNSDEVETFNETSNEEMAQAFFYPFGSRRMPVPMCRGGYKFVNGSCRKVINKNWNFKQIFISIKFLIYITRLQLFLLSTLYPNLHFTFKAWTEANPTKVEVSSCGVSTVLQSISGSHISTHLPLKNLQHLYFHRQSALGSFSTSIWVDVSVKSRIKMKYFMASLLSQHFQSLFDNFLIPKSYSPVDIRRWMQPFEKQLLLAAQFPLAHLDFLILVFLCPTSSSQM